MNRFALSRAWMVIALLFVFPVQTEASPLVQESATQEITVVARKFEFSPKAITVPKGSRVRLLVTAEDVDHGIAIESYGVDRKIQARKTETVEFIANQVGRFKISCSVFCGRGHSDMEGLLIVTDSPAAAPSTGLQSNLQVRFDDKQPGVVYVESNGSLIRIDTASKTVSQVQAPAPVRAEEKAVAEAAPQSRPEPEPYDYRLVNVPTPKRVPKNSLNVHFSHRFSTPVRQEEVPVRQEAEELFGLDSFSVSALGFTYGITDRLYASVFRSPVCQPGLCRTIEIGLGYHLLDEAGRSPLALSVYGSVEGDDNFTENFTYNAQAMIARSITKYVNVFFAPALHINSNGQGRFNPRPEDFFPPSDAANRFELGTHTGSFGFGVNGRVTPTVSLLFEYTPRVGFKLGRVLPIFSEDFSQIVGFDTESEAEVGFGIEKRLGRHAFSLTFSNTQTTTTSRYNSSNLVLPPSRFTIGFNLFRRLK